MREIETIKEHVNAFRFIDKKRFTDLVNDWERDFPKKNGKKMRAKISEVQIDALFEVLDLDGNG